MDIINARCRKIREDDLERLMNWRMDPDITRYMNTDPVLTMEGQRKWYEKICKEYEKGVSEDREGYYWVIEVDGVPAGFVSLAGVDRTAGKVHTGVYIGEKTKRSLRLTMDLQWNLYRYSFDVLGMNKVCEEVFEANKGVNRILDMCGSVREGVIRNDVCKNGVYYNVVVRGILKDEWDKKKKNLEYNFIDFE